MQNLSSSPPNVRPRRRPPLVLLAVTAAVVVALALALLRSSPDAIASAPASSGGSTPSTVGDVPAPPADGRALRTEPSTGPSTTAAAVARKPSTTVGRTDASQQPTSGRQAVAAFTSAVGRGDGATAWGLLSSRSRSYWRTQTRFEATMPELQEGYGRWARAKSVDVTSVPILSSGEGEVLIVTLSGSVSSEGPARFQAQAFPVRNVRGVFRVELWDLGAGGTGPEVHGPAEVVDGTMRTGDRTPAFQAKARGEELHWVLDGRDAVTTDVGGYQPEKALSPGTHVLTVASLAPGWLTATAVVVVVS